MGDTLVMHRRDAARLAALQVLYEEQMGTAVLADITARYARGRGPTLDDGQMIPMDMRFFRELLQFQADNDERIAALIDASVAPKRSPRNLDKLLRLLLRLGVCELLHRDDISVATIINSYLLVCGMYFDDGEKRFANGVLQKIAGDLRQD